jgi:hypothetical protein
VHYIGIPQQNRDKQLTDRVPERSTSTENVDQVPNLKDSPYLSRMVDSHPNGNPLNKEKGDRPFYFGLEDEEIFQRCSSSLWNRGSGKGGEGT